jgi:hypothetical protein
MTYGRTRAVAVKPRRGFRRRVVSATGRNFIVCGCRRALPIARALEERASATNLAWITGATLCAVLIFSVYAANRPPTFPEDPLQHAQISSLTSHTFAEVLSAAGSR